MEARSEYKVRFCFICGSKIVPHIDRRNVNGNVRNRKVCDEPRCIAESKRIHAQENYVKSEIPFLYRELTRRSWTGGALMKLTGEKFAKVVTAILTEDSGFSYSPMKHKTEYLPNERPSWQVHWAEEWDRTTWRVEEARVLSRGGKIGHTSSKY